MLEFEWDDKKAESNHRKHGISFDTAMECFYYPSYERVDDRHDYGEKRYIGIGTTGYGLVLTIVYTERDGRIRIISARKANKDEREVYEYYCKKPQK